MIDYLIALQMQNQLANDSNDPDKNKKVKEIVLSVLSVLYLAFFIWALIRARQCSQATPDSRAIHYLFAVASPVLYVIFSYSVPGFCPKRR